MSDVNDASLGAEDVDRRCLLEIVYNVDVHR